MITKRRLVTGLLSLGLLAGGLVTPMVYGQDAGGAPANTQHGGRGQAGFHLIPRFAEQQMDLTDDQKQQVADLEKETKTKLAAILSADQMKILNTARPPRPGQGGGPGGGQGGGGQPDQGGAGSGGDQGPGGPPPGN